MIHKRVTQKLMYFQAFPKFPKKVTPNLTSRGSYMSKSTPILNCFSSKSL